MVYKPNDDNDDKVGKRKHYQQKLLEAGLILTELPSIDKSHDQIYIYATPEALFEKAEFLKMRKNINEKFLNQVQYTVYIYIEIDIFFLEIIILLNM